MFHPDHQIACNGSCVSFVFVSVLWVSYLYFCVAFFESVCCIYSTLVYVMIGHCVCALLYLNVVCVCVVYVYGCDV